ncbi:E3 ubiquitin-protein ligase TRIM21-like [Sparus aurata]|uniref:E3 ubiquitin-protein ligase TRIM21-like n=1 Tax=Sparus aurata TaxID=8175 RepID=UPI0011C1C818|nr:E3 ubiquitin-protein ligase TRIM21-like [Sparus aurata]
MSVARSPFPKDQLLCSICQHVFTDPVSTPCGHNFCKNCISEHWDINVPCKCPNCKKRFKRRPVLQVNSLISEIVSRIKESAQQRASSSSEQQAANPREVPCDICTGTKLKALKSCLVCLVSYCETHLQPHLTVSGLKRHQLIDPVENLEGRMCMKHDKLLELFCKDDQTCVCMLCTISDHKQHEVVPLKEECEGRKAELEETEAELQQMIQQRQLKIEEIKQSVKVSKENADREIARGVQVLTRLRDAIERKQAEAIKVITSKHTLIEKQAEGFIKELEQELCELKKKSAELEQLSLSEDHLRLLQNLQSLKAAPPTKDWTEVRVRSPSYEGNMRSASAPLVEMLIIELKKLLPKTELRTAQQSAVDVTLDPDTAHCQLLLSGDGEQVCHPKYGDFEKKLPDNPKRFSTGLCVVGKQVISTGRFYFEVQVKGKTQWVIGVAKESINRKGLLYIDPQNGYWTLGLRKENKYYAPACRLNSKSQPEKVGVFVDYEEGLVLFYDVDAANLIHAFTGCSFTERLLPFFCPSSNQAGKNSAPLIICPVNRTT